MPDAFENILGQPQVRHFLRSSVKTGRVSHAYLFTGPSGSNKTAAAYAFAQAILCPKGALGPRGGECGACDICQRIKRGKHPDVQYYAPEGASGYLVEQIRQIVAQTSRAPLQARRKVYLLDRVDLLGSSAANAFLKTLEEPPVNVVLILLGRTRESVLPTIASRCQVVPFRHIPAHEAAGIIAQNTGASLPLCRIAIASCNGSITRGIEFLKSNERLSFRARILEVLALLRNADDWDLLTLAGELVVLANAPLDIVREAQEEELVKNADFLEKSALRQIEVRNKRALSAKSQESLKQLTAIMASWLRDVMTCCVKASELLINEDVKAAIEDAARYTDEASIVRALGAVKRCDEAITYNVSPETCIDALLYEVKEGLYGANSAG